ncbi:hypothetical protein LPC08_02145 [Roseomonas sp. OT10]|uniref:hypothetical protein n=1 Tax=Roseomonas cutis TaxID=2897332 RepID=UPI001E59D861|nr:hypothetical protein [Roseomonas sp. OT10]UFN49470.1 hypothetical protein LPC08_02145 [Roseomonas sp. OT10]
MSRFYLYLPWDDDQGLINGAVAFAERIDHLGGYDEVDILTPNTLAGAKVGDDDELYVSGECNANVDVIGSKDGRRLTARELAAQFDGRLAKTHRSIHVWACYSGHGMEGVVSPLGRIGLAHEFWKEMHAAGFKQLAVFGYRFAVLDPLDRSQADLLTARILPGFRSLSETPTKIEFLPGNANNWMTGIAADGSIVPPAPLPRPNNLTPLP